MEEHVHSLPRKPALSQGHRIAFSTVIFQPTENQFMHQSPHTAAARACLKLLKQICDPYAWDSQHSIHFG